MARSMVILDTNILIEVTRGNQLIVDACDKLGSENLSITCISFAEFLRGNHDKESFEKAKNYLYSFRILPFHQDITNIFIDIYINHSLSHRPAIPDMLIAATALHYDMPVYTLNRKDFQFIPKLKLIKT